MGNQKELIVWQRAMDLAKEVYLLVKKLPKSEMYVMGDQMRRAAISIPSNIAEGHARQSKKEYAYFLSIVQGSKAELETQLELCVNVGLLTSDDIFTAKNQLDEIGKMIYTIVKSVKQG